MCVMRAKLLQSCPSHSTLWTVALQAPLDSPCKNTGVGRHALLQGIFLTQGWNPRLYISCIGRQNFYH